MRSACSATLAAVLLLAGCGQTDGGERAELERLERSLTSLSGSPEGSWLDRLDEIKKLEISSPRVQAIRETCVAAYETFGEATARLAQARDDVARLEGSLGSSSGGAGDVAGLHARASRATQEVSSALDRAEALVGRCQRERNELREALAAGR